MSDSWTSMYRPTSMHLNIGRSTIIDQGVQVPGLDLLQGGPPPGRDHHLRAVLDSLDGQGCPDTATGPSDPDDLPGQLLGNIAAKPGT